MALLDWIGDHSAEEIQQLADAIEAGDVGQERVDRLRELIEDTPQTIREDAAEASQAFDPDRGGFITPFNDLEAALGLRETMPPAPGEGEAPGAVEFEGEPPETIESEDRQAAVSRIEDLLQPAPGRDFDFFADLAQAFESGSADPTTSLTQDTIDALTAGDLDRFAERARQLRDAGEDLHLEDFPGIQAAIAPGGGRDEAYFRNVLRELEGEIGPERLPADELERLRVNEVPLGEAIDQVQEQIDRLTGDQERRDRGPDVGVGEEMDMRDLAAGPEPEEGQPFQDTDRISGESITRDPEFEERFIRFARAAGKARRLDLLPRPADAYFRLTPENQRKFFDVTPGDLFQREMRRGNFTREELISRFGFDPSRVPFRQDNNE